MKKRKAAAKFEAIRKLVEKTVEEPERFPDEAVFLALEPEELASIVTKKRLELLEAIKRDAPGTIKELAKATGRRVEAVQRDLKLLAEYELVSLRKKGRKVKPVIEKEALILPFATPKPLIAAIKSSE